MSASSSSALTKRSASGALMPPPAAPKRIKRPAVVLDEDTYTSAISHIIRRDFFPGLAETDAQREYLNAVESKDRSWIREAGKTLTQVMTPMPNERRRMGDRTRVDVASRTFRKTPSVWETDTASNVPDTGRGQDEDALGKLDMADVDMSLGAFQAKYTSEDQDSFSQIIDKHNRVKFEKNAWLQEGNRYASRRRMAQQKVIEARAAAAAAAASGSRDMILAARWTQAHDDHDHDHDHRRAAPKTHRHTAFNSLMFHPESVEQWAPTQAQRAASSSLAPPKQLLYSNTRLPARDAEPLRPPSPTLSAVRDAVSGRPRLHSSDGGYAGCETPRVNGYAFVDAQPPPPPSSPSDEDSDDAPTDLLQRLGVEKSDSKATPFVIHDASRREKMHHRMVDRIGVKRADGAVCSDRAPGTGLGIFKSEATPRFSSAPTPARLLVVGGRTAGQRGASGLTPAAQRLLQRVGATPRQTTHSGRGGGFGMAVESGREYTAMAKLKRKQ